MSKRCVKLSDMIIHGVKGFHKNWQNIDFDIISKFLDLGTSAISCIIVLNVSSESKEH